MEQLALGMPIAESTDTMHRLSLLIVTAMLVVGCVKSSTHRDMRRSLQSDIEARDGDLAKKETQVGELESALAATKERLALLATALETSRNEKEHVDQALARKESEVASLTGQIAEIVKDKAKLSASALELRLALLTLNARKAEADRRVAQYRTLLGKFKKLIDAGTLQVSITDGRMVLALPSDVLFSSGRAELSEEGRQTIAEVASVLATIPERRFQVEGHTDNVPIRTKRFPSNWELASARAVNVVGEMIQAGVDPGSVSGASQGEYRPVSSNDDETGRAQNRRIEIVLVPDLSMLPGFEELKNVVGGS